MYPARSSYKSLNLPNEFSLENYDASKTKSDDKMIAPMGLLTQFLSTVMQKDYSNALVLCKLIQQFEPTNSTAKAFYPMIVKKLKQRPIFDSESSSSEEEDLENEVEVNQDSGIEKEDDSSSDDESDNDEEGAGEPTPPVKPLNHLEAQKEIVKHLRSKVVPNVTNNKKKVVINNKTGASTSKK